ncbi:MAG: pyrroline-5-carboxylate reductase [Lentisphaeria bacterium]|nr:pyrroline-5-carboxylate reductase [Lentisphaeria bacterium]
MNYELGFIGAGKMGGAISGGLVAQNVFSAAEVAAFDVNPKAAEEFSRRTGGVAYCRIEEALPALHEAPTVLLAVKPQVLEPALRSFVADGAMSPLSRKLVISIVAGVPISKISGLLANDRIVRVMPNTPALIGAGAAAFAPGAGATAEDIALVEKILASVGMARQMREADLDAVTALSGSGPAYVFAFIQALADGGVAEGLSREAAQALAVQTVLGSAEMVARSGEHPAVLKDAVTSPGGTTIRALEVLEDRGFAGAVIQAVRAAARRSRELGGGK